MGVGFRLIGQLTKEKKEEHSCGETGRIHSRQMRKVYDLIDGHIMQKQFEVKKYYCRKCKIHFCWSPSWVIPAARYSIRVMHLVESLRSDGSTLQEISDITAAMGHRIPVSTMHTWM